jgi:cell division protein FtsB
MMNYTRDKASGALIISNPEKEREILSRRRLEDEIKILKEEINTLKRQVKDLIAERN